MKYQNASLLLALSLLFTGCAATSGLQTYDLPDEGNYKTEQGAEISVVQLTQKNLPGLAIANTSIDKNISDLFNKKYSQYKLSPGDILSIQLWAYPELAPPNQDGNNLKGIGYPIDINGNIYLPLVGQIRAAGRSLPEINRYLRTQYAQYLKNPDLIVRVLSYEGRRFFVNGQVGKSGQYNINDQPISLYTALGMAGGINSQNGDNNSIQLIRNGHTYDLNIIDLERQGYSLHNLLIQPNDTIFVGTKQDQKLYVMGEGNKNQPIILRDQGMSLSDVLGESEGINPYTASAARIYIMRTNLQYSTSTIYHLNLSSFGNLALANQFLMHKNDIVYIDATGLTRWQRVIGQIVPFASAIYSFQALGND